MYVDSYYEALAAAGLTGWLADGTDARDENGCLIWPDGKSTGGYGVVYREPDKPEYVHRVAHEAAIGLIPDGWHVDHVYARGCRSRACFWPGHLEAVTQAENNRRGGEARRDRGQRLCGHSWDDDRPGRSDCKVCHREQERDRKAAAGPSKGVQRARLIRSLAEDGWPDADIAARAECSPATVRRVLAGEVYADAA